MSFPLQVATKRELESKAQDVKFFIELDWLRNRWEHSVDSYDKWIQFREIVYLVDTAVTSATVSTIIIPDNLGADDLYANKFLLIKKGGAEGQIRRIRSHVWRASEGNTLIILSSSLDIVPYAGVSVSIVNIIGVNDPDGYAALGAGISNAFGVTTLENNLGDGTVTGVEYTAAAQSDTWTLVCITTEEIDGVSTSRFLVKGDINGVREDAFTDQLYDNGYLSFTVNSGARQFEEGDTFIIRPALTTRKSSGGDFQSATIINGTDYRSSPELYGGPDFISWGEIYWEGQNINVYVRTSNNKVEPTWSTWSKVTSNMQLSGEQFGAYLQVKVEFAPLSTGNDVVDQALIYGLKIKYKVKAHTNYEEHYQHAPDFIRVKSMRISRSRSEDFAGYSAADLNITWDNTDSMFSKENVDSPYFPYLKPNVGIKAYTGFIDELIPRIDGFIDGFQLQAGSRSLTTRGKDRVKLLIKRKIKKGDASFRAWTDRRLTFLIKVLALDAKFPLDELDLFDVVADPVISYASFAGKSVWEAMQSLCTGVLADIFLTEDGYLKVVDRFSPKYTIPSPSLFIGGADYLNIAHNDYFTQPYFTVMYKDTIILYGYLGNETKQITEGVYGLTYVYNDDFQVGRERHNIWFTGSQTLYRLVGSRNEIIFEEIATIQAIASDIFFTNLLIYNKISQTLMGGYSPLFNTTAIDPITDTSLTVADSLGAPDSYLGKFVLVNNGAEAGKLREIVAHTATIVYIDRAFSNQLTDGTNISIIDSDKRDLADKYYYSVFAGVIVSDEVKLYKLANRDLSLFTNDRTSSSFVDWEEDHIDPLDPLSTEWTCLFESSKFTLDSQASHHSEVTVFKISGDDGSVELVNYDDTFDGAKFFHVPEGVVVQEGLGLKDGKRIPWAGNNFQTGYSQNPSSWRFGDTKDEIVLARSTGWELVGDYYRVVYRPIIPFTLADTLNIFEDYRFYRNLNYNNQLGILISIKNDPGHIDPSFTASPGDTVTGPNGSAVVTKYSLPDSVYGLYRLYIRDVEGEFEEGDTITISGETAKITRLYQYDLLNETQFNRLFIVYYETGSNFHGHLFYCDTSDLEWGPGSIVIKSTSLDFAANIPGSHPLSFEGKFAIAQSSMVDVGTTGHIGTPIYPDGAEGLVHKLIGIESMPCQQIIVVVCECFKLTESGPPKKYSKTEFEYRLFWFKVNHAFGSDVDPGVSDYYNGEKIYGMEILDLGDPRVKLHDIVYNPVYKHLDLMGGVGDTVNTTAKLYRWSLTNVVVEFNNLAGKPFTKVYPDNALDMDVVVHKDYYYYFQKYGGFKSTTSEVYAWTDFVRGSDDKDRCRVKQEIIQLEGDVNGNNVEFVVPLDNRPFDLQYVYIEGEDLGSNFLYDGEKVFLFEPPMAGYTITAGAGKRLYKHFGTFLTYDSSILLGGIPTWRDFTVPFNPVKPCKLCVTINGDCLAGLVHIEGQDEFGVSQSEDFDFGGPGVLTDDNGDRYLEGDELFSAFNVASPLSDADTCYNSAASRFKVESVYSDLIPGVILEIFTSISDLDDQFGGDGTLSGYVDKALISVRKEGGLVEVSKISSEKRFMKGTVNQLNGVLYMGTEYRGYGSRYSLSGLDPIADFILEYDKNIMDLSYGWDDNSIKNEIIVKSNKMETIPFRDINIENGDDISGEIPPSGYTIDEWLWARLERVWKNSAPHYLYKGNYIEYDINFKDPVDNGGQVNNIRFNAQFVENIGTLDASGNFQDDDPTSDFPNHKVSDTQYVLHAGYGIDHEVPSPNPDKYYRVFAPWDNNTAVTLQAVYPLRYEGDYDNPGGQALNLDLTNGVDLSTNYAVALTLGGVTQTVDCRTNATDATKVTATEIAAAINEIFDGYPAKVVITRHTGAAHVVVQLTNTDKTTSLVIADAASNSAMTILFAGTVNRSPLVLEVGEMEKKNVLIFAGPERQPLTYEAGDFDIVGIDTGTGTERWVLELTTPAEHADKLLQLLYPDRINVKRQDIDKTYRSSDGDISSVEVQGSKRFLQSYTPIGTLYTPTYSASSAQQGLSGFHLNMLWPNDETLHGTSFLRIENPTNDPLDSLYVSSETPSKLGVWLNKIELRGLPIVSQATDMAAVRDEKSIGEYEKAELTFTNEFIQDADTALKIANFLLSRKAHPIIKPSVTVIGLPNLQLADTVSIREINSGLAYDLCEILSMDENLQGSKYTMTLSTFKVLDKPIGLLLIPNIYEKRLFESKFTGAL